MAIYITAVHPGTATGYQGFTHYRWLDGVGGKAATTSRERMVQYLKAEGGEQGAGSR